MLFIPDFQFLKLILLGQKLKNCHRYWVCDLIIPYLEINKLVCYYFMDAGRKQNTTWSEPGLHCFWSWCSKRPELQHTCVGSLSQVPLVVKNMPANTGDMRLGLDPWVGRIPWRRAWQPNPVVLPGESLEQKSLVG